VLLVPYAVSVFARCFLYCFHSMRGTCILVITGFQCTAISLAFIIIASFLPVGEWNTADLNRAVRYGDELYASIISASHGRQQIFLMPSDLSRLVEYQGHHIEINYQVDQICGMINLERQESLEHDFMATPFRHGLTTAFLDSNFVLLTVGELTVALVYDNVHETFHVIDSHARNSMGVSSGP